MKRRSESFFGMHFDFHAGKNQKNVGSFCDYETIDKLLTEVKPDYVQCDTKGHPGFSSYPTKVGTHTPEIKGDILKMWREETLKHDVALFSHYSGVWDAEAVRQNPDWAAVDINGQTDEWANSLFGPYADKLLIPQLKELAREYGMDGAWVDGDCWGTTEDYCHWAKDAYKKETGLDLPEKDDFEGREKYRNFLRRAFIEYVDHYCREVHREFPKFQIASNWLYTSYVPEPEEADVDFISGDYSPVNSLNSARTEGRAMQNSTKPWDLMCWGFTRKPAVSKSLNQMCLEASEVISLGGGFSIYNPQIEGTIEKHFIGKWAELAKFCRDREETCHKSKPVHEGAVILSREAMYHHKESVYRRWGQNANVYGEDMNGILQALIDTGYSTELLMTHQFLKLSNEEMNEFSFFAVSDLDTIEEEIKERLTEYVRNGGLVIVSSPNSCKVFEKELGVSVTLKPDEEKKEYRVVSCNKYSSIISTTADVTAESAEVLDWYYPDRYLKDEQKHVFSTVRKEGKGTWMGIYLSLSGYQDSRNIPLRDILEEKIKEYGKGKKVEINTHIPEVILTKKNGKLNVNLINTNAPHSDDRVSVYDEIVPLYGVKVSVEFSDKPKSVIEIPSGRKLDFEYTDGKVEFTLDKLEIHSVITIE